MINFNGRDLSSDIRVTDVKRPVLPPSLITSSTIVGRPGAFLFYKQHGSYTIPVDFMIIEKKQTELRNKVRSLAEKLDTTEPAPLIFKDEPDKYINAIVSDESELSETLAIGSGTINFFCPDPYWYAVKDDVITKTGPGEYNFTRKGTAESYPLIEIKGSSSGGGITVSDGNNKMTFRGSLSNGETLVLDTDLITAYIVKADGKTVSVLDKLDTLDFPVLRPGASYLSVSVSGATVSNVKITCRSRWK
ncbi:distal tail protein Dit [Bacillus wiedmannii]|uniref:distal tail protein Dit n=1 Tax=Bacillus wiedmannii TaxID=1890302 RepID=UPI0014821F1B|nr:distal tail protein Dit [Bacillus wiedmannii]